MSLRKICFLLLLPLLVSGMLAGCVTDEYQQEAQRLAHEFIITDTHVDLPYRLYHGWEDVSERTESGNFDYVRAKEGGLDAPFMSIYIPAEYQETGGAKALADSLIDMVERIADEHPDKFALATSPEEIESNFEDGLISLPMGMENGAPIEGNLENVAYFYDRGIRYITLTHAKDNHISDSSYDTLDTHGGLSDFGENVVREMNRVGMMVDVSHLSDSAFYDVMRVTEAPVIASHSSCRHFTPGWERNMGDEMIKRLADNGGVIMINFGSSFLDQKSLESGEEVRSEISNWIEEQGLNPSDPEAEAYEKEYFREHYVYSNVSKVADHIDHVVDLVGIDHVGIGSDYDGVGFSLPKGLKDVSTYPNLIEELLRRGYTEEQIRKICYENLFSVWNRVHRVAGDLQSS